MNILLYLAVGIFGVLVGSFLNVLILRLPKGEDVVFDASHCPVCEKQLHWYELVPIFSFLIQRGKCRGCSTPISKQYPLIEFANSVLWLIAFWRLGFSYTTVCFVIAVSMLLAISVIDARTMVIQPELNRVILVVAVITVLLNLSEFEEYFIGMLLVSAPLFLLFIITDGKGIGFGDVKLMATCGLLIGGRFILLGFLIGCGLGSVLHLIRMKFFNADNQLALGPYLAAGVYIATLWGIPILTWYFLLFIS
ncbi:MAG: prepilin peptidase [Eubacteriales bacterium]